MYAANVVDIRRSTEAGAPVLASRRLPRRATMACALVCALAAPAVSSAQDGRALSSTSSLAGTTSTSQDRHGMELPVGVSTSSLAGTTSTPSQDLRSPDNRVPALVRSNPGIDGGGSNIAAAIILGLLALGSAAAGAVAQRKGGRPRIATVARNPA